MLVNCKATTSPCMPIISHVSAAFGFHQCKKRRASALSKKFKTGSPSQCQVLKMGKLLVLFPRCVIQETGESTSVLTIT